MAKQASRMMIGIFVVISLIILAVSVAVFRIRQILHENSEICFVLQ